MTENEAIKELYTSIDLAKMCVQTSDRKKEIEAYNTAIQALKDILQYRAIGTIEEFKALKVKEHNYDNCHNLTCRRKCEKDGYAKAIEEFAERVKEVHPFTILELEKLDEIAEGNERCNKWVDC